MSASVRVSSSSTAPTTKVTTSSMRVPELSRLLTSILIAVLLVLDRRVIALRRTDKDRCRPRPRWPAAQAPPRTVTMTRFRFCPLVSGFFVLPPFLPVGLGAVLAACGFSSAIGAAYCAVFFFFSRGWVYRCGRRFLQKVSNDSCLQFTPVTPASGYHGRSYRCRRRWYRCGSACPARSARSAFGRSSKAARGPG